jgi:hypothetical protein
MAEDEAPSWLTVDNSVPPPAPAAAAPVAAAAPPPAANTTSLAPRPTTPMETEPVDPNAEEMSDEDRKKMANVILFMRLINMGAAIAMVTHSVLTLMYLPAISKWIMSGYALCAGCLICCQETQLSFIRTSIAMNFGFLFDPFFRFAYYFLMASVEWSFGNLFGRVVAGALMGVAVYNTYVLYAYPSYRKIRDEIAAEEDERINKKIQARVQREAANSVNNAMFGSQK